MDLVLSNGNKMPALGLGTVAIDKFKTNKDSVKTSILTALEVGYRHIDTATLYKNEVQIGEAIASSGIKREDLFITTKVWNTDQGYENTIEACKRSLDRLKLSYVDLYLIHWPLDDELYIKTYEALERLYSDGLAKSIGLSNFYKKHLDKILSMASIAPVVNQIEINPYFVQEEIVRYCKSKNIVVTAWSPLGSGSWSGIDTEIKPVSDPVIKKIADKYGKTPAQVIIRWLLSRGLATIPKSEKEHRIKENFQVLDFDLDEDDNSKINALDRGKPFASSAYNNGFSF